MFSRGDYMKLNKGITKTSDISSSPNSEKVNKFDGTIPEGFFACFFAFYNGIKVGNCELVMYNLHEMKKSITDIVAPDVFRLVYINLVQSFSRYLGEDFIEPYFEISPATAEEAFEIAESLADKYFEKLCFPGSNSECLKHEVVRMVENEFSNPHLSVTMLADRLGISTSYLSRYFKEKMGVTLFAYIDEIRLSNAKKLLTETDAPVKDIVRTVGYNDINNFNRKFKSRTGLTPSIYRK